ncbi:hypothetical protein SAMD00019534_046660 [Acytostelium subglobosum LB1]|uniref:hypothetical protein n=1 Tax=Acytostelium subglobosum LB1 TaxID=1410327 RepID=UPI000644BE1F|nr:hypothetical protein SAMD00019534_046660 [Acytostelium subglobosum LB1]GAM21491.1 hypothetical protein SAMD00019534_046660 [Acytostelium subglobosum LB1]|eukprot:XP_012755610.1 hypothetical protein SAMD00019534_046660 [Acytostelium subglobosum LB1]
MKFLSSLFKKKVDVAGDPNKATSNRSTQSLSPTSTTSTSTSTTTTTTTSSEDTKANLQTSLPAPTHTKKSKRRSGSPTRGGDKHSKGDKDKEKDKEAGDQSIICLHDLSGLVPSDRRWVEHAGINEQMIHDNFALFLNVVNFLRKDTHYKFVDPTPSDQSPIIMGANKSADVLPSLVITTCSPMPAEKESSPEPEASPPPSPRGSATSDDTSSSNASSNPTTPAGTSSSRGRSSGPGFVGVEKKKYLDSDRIFIAPGKHCKFPEELGLAIEKLLNNINAKDLYKNIDFEAKGGFGMVYAGRLKNGTHNGGDRQMVALKKMEHRTAKQRRMNLNEIGFMKFCQHPNITTFLCAHQRDDDLWMVMEYLEGGTLREAINNFVFGETKIAHIAKYILRALHYLHSNGICHRDLKSANVMISLFGDIKIIDLGLAIDFGGMGGEDETHDRHMCGSPFWMPPEQIQGKPHTFSLDIWSFGVCLMEMMRINAFFQGSRLKAMFGVAVHGIHINRADNPDWSDTLYDFLESCLQFEPTKRPTAQQLLEHPFISKACTSREFCEMVPAIFMSNNLSRQGLL